MNPSEFNDYLNTASSTPSQRKIAKQILRGNIDKAMLLTALDSDDVHLAQKASSVAVLITEEVPEFFRSDLKTLLEKTEKSTSSSQKRVYLRVLESSQIDEDNEGMAYEVSFGLATDPTQAIAVRAYSLGILSQIADKYPELKEELRETLDLISAEPELSAGMIARIKNVRKSL